MGTRRGRFLMENTFASIFATSIIIGPLSGIYIFALEDEQGGWHALYVGQTENLKSHLNLFRNKLLDEAVRRKCTHIHAIDEADEAKRDEVVKALIQQHQPPMNSQQRD